MIIRSKAPLRLGIAGGGTDIAPYCDEFGGYVLNATISLYAHCSIEPMPESSQVIEFQALDFNQGLSYALCAKDLSSFALPLHVAVYRRIVKQFNNNQPLYLKISTYCDVPSGSGLGGSSTLVVAMLKAYVEWLGLPLGEYEIAQLAFDIERIDAKMSGGKQDQFSATFGGFNFMEFGKDHHVIVNPLRIKNWIIDELEESLLLYFTGVSRASGSIIDQQINNFKNKNTQAMEAMHDVKQDALLLKNALLTGKLNLFAELLGKAWEAKKKMAFGIANSEINHVYEIALKAGAISGKVSGAGGGGFMLFYCDPRKRLKVKEALESCGGEVLPFEFVKEGTRGWRID